MQNLRLMSAIAATAVLASGAAFAADGPFRGQATLANAGSAKEATIAGVAWKCEGDSCSGFAERRATLDSHVKECRKVASAFGPLTSYRSRGRELSPGNLSACNRAAAVQSAAATSSTGN